MKPTQSLFLISLLAACANTPIITPPPQPPPPVPAREIGGLRVLGELIVVRLSGIGTAQPSASAAIVTPVVRPQSLSKTKLQFSNPSQTVASSSDAFAIGGPRSAGKRYLYATVTFINTGPALENLAFIATRFNADTGTAVNQLERFPGLAAYTTAERNAIALSIQPTSPVSVDPFTLQPRLIQGSENALQVYSDSELLGAEPTSAESPNADLLPYGFAAHAGSNRTIPSGAKVTLTIAYRIPMQALAKDDPYSVTLQFQVAQNSKETVTESLEAQLPVNQAAFNAAKTNIGGQLRVMPGTTQATGEALCGVRTAGSADSPTAYLVNTAPSAVNISSPTLTMTIGQTRPLGATLNLSGSSGVYSFADVSVTDSSVASINAGQITALKAGTTNLSIDSCGRKFTTTLNVREQP